MKPQNEDKMNEEEIISGKEQGHEDIPYDYFLYLYEKEIAKNVDDEQLEFLDIKYLISAYQLYQFETQNQTGW